MQQSGGIQVLFYTLYIYVLLFTIYIADNLLFGPTVNFF